MNEHMKKVVVTVEATINDETRVVAFDMDPQTFQMTQHRHLIPEYDNLADGRPSDFKPADPHHAFDLTISGSVKKR